MSVEDSDVWYRGKLLGLSSYLVKEMQSLGFNPIQELIWARRLYYSPYGPSFTHIFILARVYTSRIQPDVLRYTVPSRHFVVPVPLFRHLILSLSSSGDWILNPYLGSGSFVEAAFQTGRNSLGIELDTLVYRQARAKLIKVLGRGAVHFIPLKRLGEARL